MDSRTELVNAIAKEPGLSGYYGLFLDELVTARLIDGNTATLIFLHFRTICLDANAVMQAVTDVENLINSKNNEP